MNKKLLKSFFAVVLAVAGIFAISHYSNAGVKGDVNGDGSITAADVTAVYDVLLGNNSELEASADVNHDGSVTAADVTFIYDILLGNTPTEFEHVYILGNATEWNPAQGQEMTTEDGVIYTATLEASNVYDGYSWFSFTTQLANAESETPWEDIEDYRFGAITDGNDFLVTNETLGTAIPLTNEDYHAFQIPTGKYELSLNITEMTLTITKVEEPQPETEVYILGEVNGNTWSAYNGVQMTTEDGVVFTAHVTTTGENNGYSYFSFTKALADPNSETPWVDIESQRFGAASEGDFLVTSEMAGQSLPLTYENVQAFKIPAGEYDLTVNMTEMTLVIEGEIVDPVTPQPENKVYILGTVNGNEWATNNGVEMTTTDNKIYTATITTETFSYFSFTTALSEAADDWDGIAEYRFGAVGDADVLVTEEYLGEALPLTNTGYQALKIAAGEFALTLNMEEMTLKIEGEFAPQPQPENNWYLIGTNNGWSTSDMSYKFTQSTENANVYSIHVDNVSGDFWFKIANEDCYTAADFWNGGTILSAATNGESALTGNLVEGNQGAFCLPASYHATYFDLTIDVENLTYTITTDGQEPVIDPTAEYDYVYIAGTADGWSGNGGKLASVKGANDYYGFINATGEFKIQKDKGSWATNWGGTNGNLVADGANILANGLVYVNANLNNMSYSVTNITSMGIIGDAVNADWATEAPLTYNAETGAWEATGVVLNAGSIKFRANNAWEINFGGALDNLVINGDNITVEAGTYNVVLTLVCPGEYTATITPAN